MNKKEILHNTNIRKEEIERLEEIELSKEILRQKIRNNICKEFEFEKIPFKVLENNVLFDQKIHYKYVELIDKYKFNLLKVRELKNCREEMYKLRKEYVILEKKKMKILSIIGGVTAAGITTGFIGLYLKKKKSKKSKK